ncbi:MAG TPA: serine hydrolase domain-containing protein [Gemmatimonadaceae bacterium]|nr:serine hydrolase domain-containing protein [Gemmatimonadaceae bacterium]
MLKRILTLTGLIASTAIGASAQTVDPRLESKVDSIANQVLQSSGVPSASVAIVQHGRMVFAKAYGAARLDPRAPATVDMRYGIGSISKQFTASAILSLQQEGKLKLDDPVGKYIPGLSRGNEVTIRQILSHTSGYQDFWPQDYLMEPMRQNVTPLEIMDRWAKQPLDFEPGTRWQYSNTGYVLAAMIVEKVSGRPFFRYVQTRLLKPLGLTSAKDFDSNPHVVDATGYIRYGLGPLRPAPDAGKGWMYGAGMLAMTASDLAKWDISLITRSLLKPASYQAMFKETTLKNGAASGYGLGQFTQMSGGHFLVEHNGEVSGFTAENYVFPEDSAAVVVLTNQDAAPASGAIANQIARFLFTVEDALAANRTAQAKAIFEGLQKGTVDRSLFTPNANGYFSDVALKDFAESLAPLGAPTGFVQTSTSKRGGMTLRSYRATFSNGRTLRAWTFETADGKLEQYQVAPIG